MKHTNFGREMTSDERELIVNTVRQFVEQEVIPVASAMEHRDEYPTRWWRRWSSMGLFGLNVPEEYGGAEMDYTTFAMVFEELARGWLGLGRHSRNTSGGLRYPDALRHRRAEAALLADAGACGKACGRCVCRSRARAPICRASPPPPTRDGDGYIITGSKMWITNARRAGIFRAADQDGSMRAARPSRHERVHHRERARRA